MTAPTEAEITAAVDEHVSGRHWVGEWYEAAGMAKDGLWNIADLRPSENSVVDAIMEAEAAVLNNRIEAEAIAAALRVLQRVAEELPALPRSVPEVDAADIAWQRSGDPPDAGDGARRDAPMTSPSEAEIRRLFDERQNRFPDATKHLTNAIAEFFDLIDYRAPSCDPDDEFGELGNYVFTNLRPTEAARLQDLVQIHAGTALETARDAIYGELVAAVMAFATEHPDAPRQAKPDLAA